MMPLVPAKRTTVTSEDIARALELAFLKRLGKSSRAGVAMILAQVWREVGTEWSGLFNYNLFNVRPYSKTDPAVLYYAHPGRVSETRADGSVDYNVDKHYRGFRSLNEAVDNFVWQVKKRWPGALEAAIAGKSALDVSTELKVGGIGDDGVRGHWPAFMTASAKTYAGLMQQLYPKALQVAESVGVKETAGNLKGPLA